MDNRTERECLADAISDISKDVNGCRYRFNWKELPMEELRAEYEYWCEQAAQHHEQLREEEALDELVNVLLVDAAEEMYWEEIDEVYERLAS